VWPMIRMHWSNEKCFTTMAEYLERLPLSAKTAQEAGWPTGIPIIALTTSTAAPDFPGGVVHRLATRSGHWIQLDEPELVLETIRDLLSNSVQKQPSRDRKGTDGQNSTAARRS
jgi:hypothetical protein